MFLAFAVVFVVDFVAVVVAVVVFSLQLLLSSCLKKCSKKMYCSMCNSKSALFVVIDVMLDADAEEDTDNIVLEDAEEGEDVHHELEDALIQVSP